MFFMNNFNETIEDDNVETEVLNTEDVETELPSQSVSFSNGVVFTPEELNAMDPEAKAKLLKVKNDEAQMQKGFNAKLQALKAAQSTTPAPKAEPKTTNSTDPLVQKFVYGQIVEKNYAAAKANAITVYGEQAVAIMLGKPEAINTINSAIEEANVNFDFNSFFTNQFAINVSNDQAMLNAFNVFKGVKSEDQLQKEAEEKAKIELLKQKQVQSSGLPHGGARVVEPPVEIKAPTRMAEAHQRASEMMKELFKK